MSISHHGCRSCLTLDFSTPAGLARTPACRHHPQIAIAKYIDGVVAPEIAPLVEVPLECPVGSISYSASDRQVVEELVGPKSHRIVPSFPGSRTNSLVEAYGRIHTLLGPKDTGQIVFVVGVVKELVVRAMAMLKYGQQRPSNVNLTKLVEVESSPIGVPLGPRGVRPSWISRDILGYPMRRPRRIRIRIPGVPPPILHFGLVRNPMKAGMPYGSVRKLVVDRQSAVVLEPTGRAVSGVVHTRR